MADDEYEILPHKEILEIKKEIQKMKGSDVPIKTSLEVSINKLSNSIDQLMELFKISGDDIKMERHDEKLLIQKIEPLIDKFNSVLEQNEKIAKGIVAVADMVKNHVEKDRNDFEPKPFEPKPFDRPSRNFDFEPSRPSKPFDFEPQSPPQFMPPSRPSMPMNPPPNQNFNPSSMGSFNPGPSFSNIPQGPSNPPQQQMNQPSYPQYPPRPMFGGQDMQQSMMSPPPDLGDIPRPPSLDETFPEPKKRGLFGLGK